MLTQCQKRFMINYAIASASPVVHVHPHIPPIHVHICILPLQMTELIYVHTGGVELISPL